MSCWCEHRTAITAGSAAILLLAVVASALSATHHVDCAGSGFATVQAAVNTASEGDTILIAPCTYVESVIVEGKNLVFRGGGADVTELAWVDTAATLAFRGLPDDLGSTHVSDILVSHPGTYGRAIAIDAGLVVLERITTEGTIICNPSITMDDADVAAYDCDLDELWLSDGPGRASVFEDCVIGDLNGTGGYNSYPPWAADPRMELSSCEVWKLYLEGCEVSIAGGRVDYALTNHIGSHSPLRFTMEGTRGTWFWMCDGGEISLTGIALDTLWYRAGWLPGHLNMEGCLVRREIELESSDSELVHNTFGGPMRCWLTGADSFTSNVFAGSVEVLSDAPAVFTSNCFAVTPTAPSATFTDNIEADPMFCGPLDWSLQDCSPCVGAAHDGTDIGAYGVGCECSSPVSHVTWGRLKALYQ